MTALVITEYENFSIKDEENVVGLGINGKMNEAEAALGILQLKHIDKCIKKRKAVFEFYYHNIKNIPGIRINQIPNQVSYNYAYVPIFFEGRKKARDFVYKRMRKNNILCRKYWYPLINAQPIYSNTKVNIPNAEKLSDGVLCLPIYPDITFKELNKVLRVLKEV